MHRAASRSPAHSALLAVVGLLSPWMRAAADVQLYAVDPSQSTLTLQATTGTTAWAAQGTNGLGAPLQGWLAVSNDGSNLQFIAGSGVVAVQTNVWQPSPPGADTPTAADFGITATFGTGFSRDRELAAFRNLQFTIASDPIPLANGSFDASAVTFGTPAAPKAELDYESFGLVVLLGSKDLSGASAANAATDGALSFVLEGQKLTLPVDVTLPAATLPAGDTTLRLTGAIVAVHGMVLRPVLLQIASPQTPGEFTLVWSTTFKLQKATSLALQDWTDYSTTGVEVIRLDSSNAYFRATL